MSDVVVVALVTGGLALTGSVFVAVLNFAGTRHAQVSQARQELVDDQRERIGMLTDERDELRAQVRDLEDKVERLEGRPTRRTTT